MATDDRLARIDNLFSKIESDLRVLKWMAAAVLALTIVIAARVYGVICLGLSAQV